MIMSWLLNSMQPEIGKTYFFLLTMKEIWDPSAQMYFNMGEFCADL